MSFNSDSELHYWFISTRKNKKLYHSLKDWCNAEEYEFQDSARIVLHILSSVFQHLNDVFFLRGAPEVPCCILPWESDHSVLHLEAWWGIGGHQCSWTPVFALHSWGGFGKDSLEGYSMEIAVISKAYASIIRNDTCKECLTKVLKAIICRISMTPHTQHLMNRRLLLSNKYA